MPCIQRRGGGARARGGGGLPVSAGQVTGDAMKTYGELAADARVDAGVRHEALLICEVEKRAVGDARLLGAGAGVGRPCVEMGVEVDDGHWAVDLVERAEDGENDGVVPAHAVRPKVQLSD